MKSLNKRFSLFVLLIIYANAAYAQGSVTLYGLMDAGVNYISNDRGKANWTQTNGMVNGNRWGLKGAEDLGSGMKALFQLENGFSGSGTLAQGGRLFGRYAWVGLSSDTYGMVTMGRQIDLTVEYIEPLSSLAFTGIAHPFDNDNMLNEVRLNNAIKYTSPNLGGFKFGAQYAFSNSADGFAANRGWGLGAGYTRGPLALGVSYLHLNAPDSNTSGAVVGDYINENVTTTSALQQNGLPSAVLREQVWAAGVNYQLSTVRLGFVYSHSMRNSAADTLKFDNYDVNVTYQITSAFFLSGSYTFTDGKLDPIGAEPKYHQASLMFDYFLSKRTDVYLLSVYQHAAGAATIAAIAPDAYGGTGRSTSKNQTLIRLGLRHRF
ncbi:porin [Trinickia mobilis]|uniref:porin n=1 Tax=Trinickia mobilis TaxID=2816356 RepID=UPI001A8C83CB|nr:porin [Trinickia mobilis]